MVAEGFPSLAYWRVGPTEAKRLKGEKGAIGDYGPTFHPEPPGWAGVEREKNQQRL